MAGKIWIWLSAIVVLLGLLFANPRASSSHQLKAPAVGRNNTLLFLTTEQDGLSNVLIASAAALVEQHPDIEVHYASFPELGKKLARVSDFALRTRSKLGLSSNVNTTNDRIIFYPLTSAPSFLESLEAGDEKAERDVYLDLIHPPGLRGLDVMLSDIQLCISIWSAEQYLALYEEVCKLVEVVDPAVVVLDTFFQPAIAATRAKNRLHAFISPNQMVDNFLAQQPWGAAFWKYPAFSSGYTFPVPWQKIPNNIYIGIRLIYVSYVLPLVKDTKQILLSHGIPNPLNILDLYRPDTPWITQFIPGASMDPDYIPENVTLTGPLVISSASAEEQDPELVAWLRRAPTVLINLGSTTKYDKPRAEATVDAIVEILRQKPNIQILWKYRLPTYGSAKDIDEYLGGPIREYLYNGRLRVSKWLVADPAALLEAGLIYASVHHGGANCYWEAVAGGVPHVVLPLWMDHYNFAQMVQIFGIGVWGCPETSPYVNSTCLAEAILEVVDDGKAGQEMRAKARSIGDLASQKEPGRNTAARRLAQLARSGKQT